MLARRMGAVCLLLLGFGWSCARQSAPASVTATPDTARAFLREVDKTLLRFGTELNQAGWVAGTYITPDTEALNARANQNYIEVVARYAKEATTFDGVELDADERRQLDLLKLSLVMVTPSNPALAEELTRIAAGIEGAYGRGKWCPDPAKAHTCLDVEAIR